MDPYIEDPEVWSDFHGGLAAEIRTHLNTQIQPHYVARMTPRVTYEIIEITEKRGVRPDVGVWEHPDSSSMGGVATVTVTPAPVLSTVTLELPLELFTVEIRETKTMRLVTAIEILSPVNKQPSHEAFAEYQRKRRALLRSMTHLIEIDFLRGGTRPPLEEPVPPAPYYVMLSRENKRPRVEVWPLQFQDKLPVLPVPLLQPDPDAKLDLGAVLAHVYQHGGYATLIDYTPTPPPPRLAKKDLQYIDALLKLVR